MAASYQLMIDGLTVEVWKTVARIDGCSVRTLASDDRAEQAARAQEVLAVWNAGFRAGRKAQAAAIRKALNAKD